MISHENKLMRPRTKQKNHTSRTLSARYILSNYLDRHTKYVSHTLYWLRLQINDCIKNFPAVHLTHKAVSFTKHVLWIILPWLNAHMCGLICVMRTKKIGWRPNCSSTFAWHLIRIPHQSGLLLANHWMCGLVPCEHISFSVQIDMSHHFHTDAILWKLVMGLFN